MKIMENPHSYFGGNIHIHAVFCGKMLTYKALFDIINKV